MRTEHSMLKKALPNFRRKGNHPGPQDCNKNTYQANILCSLTIEVMQKHTFSYKTSATTVAELS